MQFTPQQLAGAGRYSRKTKIGNWCEDNSLEEEKLASYLRKKQAGTLLLAQERQRAQVLLQRVPMAYSSDGVMHFGDSVQLGSVATGGVLACNVFDRIALDAEVYSTSCAAEGSDTAAAATARSVFVLRKWEKHSGKYANDEVLRYGDPVLLACNPSLRVHPKTGVLLPLLHLASGRVSTTEYAPLSNHQRVAMVGGAQTYSMVWEVARVGNRKYQPKGEPVRAGDTIVLFHKATGAPLAADPSFRLVNEMGGEYETAAHQYLRYGKTLNLILESNGSCTGDVRQRAELEPNLWTFRLASSPEESKDDRTFVEMSKDQLLSMVGDAIRSRGAYSYRGLGKAFNSIDHRGNGLLTRDEFLWGLRDYGIQLDSHQGEVLLNEFDRNNDGIISVAEFIAAVQGPMEPERQAVVRQAYDKLDANCDGRLTRSDIAQRYDASQHPDVISGQKSAGEIFDEFLSHWDTEQADGIITWSEFERYYRDMSASIPDTGYFVAVIRNAFQLDGSAEEGKK